MKKACPVCDLKTDKYKENDTKRTVTHIWELGYVMYNKYTTVNRSILK